MFSVLWYFELVFVLTLVGLLAGFALKSYSSTLRVSYTVQAISVSSFLKSQIYHFYAVQRRWPNTEDIVLNKDYTDQLNNIKEITIDEGSIDIEFYSSRNNRDSEILSFRKAVFNDMPGSSLIWLCGYQPVPSGMTVVKVNKTTVNRSDLPHICK